MALIKCPECGKEISDMANSCPNCGYPIKENTQHNENTKKIYEYICDSDKCISMCPVKEFNNFLGATCKCPDCGAIAEYTETEAVSYTHLDVYKRQIHYSRYRFYKSLFCFFCSLFIFGISSFLVFIVII